MGYPYLPGSTLKGAIKTVLMYNWLKTDDKAEEAIEQVLEGKKFDWLEKQFEYKEDVFTRNVIRENSVKLIADSQNIDKGSTVVVDCYRSLPIRIESIAKNEIFFTELILNNYKWKDLAHQANEYALDALNREITLIEKDDRLIKHFNHLTIIEENIINAENEAAFFRIGYGKGYYLNSLGIAIYDYVSQEGKEDLYGKFEAFINKEYAERVKYGMKQEIDLEDFPKTRIFITKTQEPLGWIRLEAI